MHVSPLEKKGIREERDNGIKTARLFITLGRGRCVIFFFIFFLFFAIFDLIFHFADTRRRRREKRFSMVVRPSHFWPFLFDSVAHLIYFLNGWTLRHIDSLCRLVNEKMSNSIGFSQLTCSQSETGFWFVSDLTFSFLLLWNVHFFTIGRRHLYTDSQNSLWDVWLHQPKPL